MANNSKSKGNSPARSAYDVAFQKAVKLSIPEEKLKNKSQNKITNNQEYKYKKDIAKYEARLIIEIDKHKVLYSLLKEYIADFSEDFNISHAIKILRDNNYGNGLTDAALRNQIRYTMGVKGEPGRPPKKKK